MMGRSWREYCRAGSDGRMIPACIENRFMGDRARFSWFRWCVGRGSASSRAGGVVLPDASISCCTGDSVRAVGLRRLRPLVVAGCCSAGLLLVALVIAYTGGTAWAQSLSLDLGGEGESVSNRIIQLVVLVTVLSLAPSILVMLTSFTRIVVVLSFLRSALGVQQTPSNVVIISLSLFLTAFIMAPVIEEAWLEGAQPFSRNEISIDQAIDRAVDPFRRFMLAQTREQDLSLFVELSRQDPPPETRNDVTLPVLIPAFMISELRRAFEIGFLIFVPFVIIDMVVASVLMSMGMLMLPPVFISLPFKLIFFVVVDGWYLVVGSLARGFAPPVPPI